MCMAACVPEYFRIDDPPETQPLSWCESVSVGGPFRVVARAWVDSAYKERLLNNHDRDLVRA
jgi:hypothetical protein